jgi:hypothetical protein
MDKIRAIGPRLELLSLHQGRQIELSSAVLSSVSFQAICESCPNLRQIGIQSDESSYFDNDPHGEIEYFIVSTDHAIEVTHVRLTLRRVPSNFSKIYIWSFRLEENWTVGHPTDDNERDPNIMAMQVQMVADKIFGTLHRHQSCPKLGAIVFGHIKAFPMKRDDISDDDDDDDEDTNVFHHGALPQFCSIKAERGAGLGRVTAIGVPVSRVLLRRTQPCTEVLNLDPVTDNWDRWAWQAIV